MQITHVILHLWQKPPTKPSTCTSKTRVTRNVQDTTMVVYQCSRVNKTGVTWKEGDSPGYSRYSSKPESCESQSDGNSSNLRFIRTSLIRIGHSSELASTIVVAFHGLVQYEHSVLGKCEIRTGVTNCQTVTANLCTDIPHNVPNAKSPLIQPLHPCKAQQLLPGPKWSVYMDTGQSAGR